MAFTTKRSSGATERREHAASGRVLPLPLQLLQFRSANPRRDAFRNLNASFHMHACEYRIYNVYDDI